MSLLGDMGEITVGLTWHTSGPGLRLLRIRRGMLPADPRTQPQKGLRIGQIGASWRTMRRPGREASELGGPLGKPPKVKEQQVGVRGMAASLLWSSRFGRRSG